MAEHMNLGLEMAGHLERKDGTEWLDKLTIYEER